MIDMNRNGNSANFFLYVCNDRKIEELFLSTLNGITASVKCVSSITVVLNAKFARLLCGALKQKKSMRAEEARQECRVLLAETH